MKRKGLVTSTRMLVDMRYSDGTVVTNVDTKYLKHLQPFRPGNWVVSEGWLGRVISCRDDVVVQFDDASQCLVTATSNGELVAVQKMYERSPFFPSMAVKAGAKFSFKNAVWIQGSFSKQKQGVIASTRPAEVAVLSHTCVHAPCLHVRGEMSLWTLVGLTSIFLELSM